MNEFMTFVTNHGNEGVKNIRYNFQYISKNNTFFFENHLETFTRSKSIS